MIFSISLLMQIYSRFNTYVYFSFIVRRTVFIMKTQHLSINNNKNNKNKNRKKMLGPQVSFKTYSIEYLSSVFFFAICFHYYFYFRNK